MTRALLAALLLTACEERNTVKEMRVLSVPPGAYVLVNGVTKGKTPLTVKLEGSDELALMVNKEGFEPEERSITPSDAPAEMSFTLQRARKKAVEKPKPVPQVILPPVEEPKPLAAPTRVEPATPDAGPEFTLTVNNPSRAEATLFRDVGKGELQMVVAIHPGGSFQVTTHVKEKFVVFFPCHDTRFDHTVKKGFSDGWTLPSLPCG